MTIILFITIAIIYSYFLFKNNFRFISLFWIVMFSISLLLPVFIANYFTYGFLIGDEIYAKLNLIFLIALISFVISNLPFQLKRIKFKTNKINTLDYKTISKSNFIYIILGLFLAVLIGFEVVQSGTATTLELNSWIKILQSSILIGLLYTSYLKLLFSTNRKQKIKSFLIIILVIIFALLFMFGRRILIYPTIAAIIIYIYWKNKSPSLLKMGSISIGTIFIGLPLLMSIRTFGIKEGFFNFLNIIMGDYKQYINYLSIGTDVTYSYSLAAIIVSDNVRVTLLTLFKPLFIFIPRNIWPDKPGALSETLVQKLNLPFEEGMSIPPGLIGESYVYMGEIGVILAGVIFGVVCGIVDNYSQHLRNIDKGKYSINLIMITLISIQIIMGSIRGDTATNIQEALYLFIPLWIILKFAKFKIKI